MTTPSPKTELPAQAEPWVIYSNEHGAWWGPDRGGYFTLLNAGIYTEAAAKEIAARSRTRSHADRRPDDAIRLADAMAEECKNHNRLTVARLISNSFSAVDDSLCPTCGRQPHAHRFDCRNHPILRSQENANV